MISTGSLKSFTKFLYIQRVKGFDAPTAPHLDEAARAKFESLLRACSFYLEFGSGGSTVRADQLKIRGLSVEVDRFYAAAVRRALSANSTMQIIDVDVGLTRQWGKPVFRNTSRRRVERWSRYSNAPFDRLRQQGVFPDFVLIDGRFRRACALNTARHVLTAGHKLLLMFDDYYKADRTHYADVERFLGQPERFGRAALFEISPAVIKQVPTADDVAAANTDFR
jgi:hypothetical protein